MTQAGIQLREIESMMMNTGGRRRGNQQQQQQQEEETVAAGISSRRRLMKNSLLTLPKNLLINNILLKVPMNSLLNLRCVCNPLRYSITSPYFVNKHLHSTITLNKELVLIIPAYASLDLNLDPSEKPPNVFHSLNFNATDDLSCPERAEVTTPFRSPRIFGSCNGLLCLSEKDSYSDEPDLNKWQISTYSSPCIWNPATKEYKELPTPSVQNPFGETETSSFQPRLIHYGFGYDSTFNDYKVIRCETFTSKYQESITEFQAYSLRRNTWRNISTDKNPYRSYSLAHKRQGLFVNGAFHWIMYQRRKRPLKPSRRRICVRIRHNLTHTIRIISWDIEKEEFRELRSPHYLINESSTWDVQILRGCLCIHEDIGYLYPGSNMIIKINVWLMNKDGMWNKLFTITKPPLASPDSYWPAYVKLIRMMENGEILIMTNNKRLVLYDPVKDTERCVDKVGDIHGHFSYVGVYIESLVSLKSGTYKLRTNANAIQGI